VRSLATHGIPTPGPSPAPSGALSAFSNISMRGAHRTGERPRAVEPVAGGGRRVPPTPGSSSDTGSAPGGCVLVFDMSVRLGRLGHLHAYEACGVVRTWSACQALPAGFPSVGADGRAWGAPEAASWSTSPAARGVRVAGRVDTIAPPAFSPPSGPLPTGSAPTLQTSRPPPLFRTARGCGSSWLSSSPRRAPRASRFRAWRARADSSSPGGTDAVRLLPAHGERGGDRLRPRHPRDCRREIAHRPGPAGAVRPSTSHSGSIGMKGSSPRRVVLAYSGDSIRPSSWLASRTLRMRGRTTPRCGAARAGADVEARRSRRREPRHRRGLRRIRARSRVAGTPRRCVYENGYLLGTALARRCSRGARSRCVDMGADALAHVAPQEERQLRFELVYRPCPRPRRGRPVREWISFPETRSPTRAAGIPVPVARGALILRDGNLWHLSHEGGCLEDPWCPPPPTLPDDRRSPGGSPSGPLKSRWNSRRLARAVNAGSSLRISPCRAQPDRRAHGWAAPIWSRTGRGQIARVYEPRRHRLMAAA